VSGERQTAQLSARERSQVTDAMIAQIGELTRANNELNARLVALKADYDGHIAWHPLWSAVETRLDALERVTAVRWALPLLARLRWLVFGA